MNSELLTPLLGFIEGFALILSPCILSILPIILASSLSGSKKRAYGIILGFTLMFTLFALLARHFFTLSGIDSNLIRYFAYSLLLLFSIILFSNYLTEQFSKLTQRLSSVASIFATKKENGFFGGLLLGCLVAIIWTPCAGPILATILVQIAIQKTTLISSFTLLAFAAGAAIPMLIIVLYGFKIRETFPFFKRHAVHIRKILALILFLNIGYIIAQEAGMIPSAVVEQSSIRTANYLKQGVWRPYPSPEIEGINSWINSSPITLADLKGKVVLVDFWTYSCINCIRTLPYLKDWYDRYKDKGLVIIGVHTPEFDFEANSANVLRAVNKHSIKYPVALDNSYVTWSNFSNHFWPAHYLINQKGEVVYEHFGEGSYDVMENNIRFLLGMKQSVTQATDQPLFASITPETYLGYGRADRNQSPELKPDRIYTYQFPKSLAENSWALSGEWLAQGDKIIAKKSNAALKMHFKAGKVFIVMGNSSGKPIKVHLLLNGKPLLMNKGKDVEHSTVSVNQYGLYEVVEQGGSAELELRTEDPNLELYTFTFGS